MISLGIETGDPELLAKETSRLQRRADGAANCSSYRSIGARCFIAAVS